MSTERRDFLDELDSRPGHLPSYGDLDLVADAEDRYFRGEARDVEDAIDQALDSRRSMRQVEDDEQ
jgi:hypothetical protein